ncbi:MAG: CHAT domain-containing protein, partial [Planctomycetota bacterium]
SEFRQKEVLNNATFQDIQRCLSEQEAILDFLFYQHVADWQKLEKEECLIVFLITKASPVIRVDLGKVEDLRSAIEAFRSQLQGGAKRMLDNEHYADDTLSETLWKPLEHLLEGKDHLYVIPDGYLAFIPFEAIPVEGEKQYLAELKTISYLFSPLDLVEYQLYNEENELSLLCLGNVAYGDTPEEPGPKIQLDTEGSGFSEGNPIIWSALPGTAEECNTILSDFKKAYPQNSTEYLNERKASKTNLLEKAVGKKYVHLATHGYFNEVPLSKGKRLNAIEKRGGLIMLMNEEDKEEAQPVLPGVSPMFYSGIVLADANLKKEEKQAGEGYFSAEELAGLNLRNVSLLTLSGGETGLGQETQGQGVLGLPLAVYVAGAKSMLLSLWKVDDLGTQLFMERFYQRLWFEQKGKLQALQETRLEWIEKQYQRRRGPNGEDIYSPKIWASFILSGQQ